MTDSKSLKDGDKNIKDYLELIETIARIEHNRLATSSHLIDYSEIVNIGAITVHLILTSNEIENFNNSYISTAIKWAIRNELRRRYKWYAFKTSTNSKDYSPEISAKEHNQIREIIYEAVLSIDDLAGSENPTQIKDNSHTPAENLEFIELSKAIKAAIKTLPSRERIILENRFFKDKKIKEIADEFNISPSRVSRVIQSSLDKIKDKLKSQGLV